MDGTAAINNNLEALKRILAGLFAMAGSAFTSQAEKTPCEGGDEARRPDGHRPPRTGEVTLPRHLRLAILRLLRPAEAAARRLIIAAARGLVVTLPPARKPRPATLVPQLRRLGIAIVLPAIARRAATNRTTLPHPEVLANGEPRRTHFPLVDPPRRFRLQNTRSVPAHAAPRILSPGYAQPHRLPPPPSRDDPVDATRLTTRLAILRAALDDLPGQARRFARWQALRQRRLQYAAGGVRGRAPRLSPLRPGRPPGGRLARFDPAQRRGAKIRDVDEVLAHAHALALYALNPPDTS